MKNWKKSAIGLVAVVNFIPAIASGDTTSGWNAMSYGEVSSLVRGLGASGNDSDRTGHLYGRIYADCASHIRVTVTETASHQRGWLFEDEGHQARDCVAAHHNADCTDTAGDANFCYSVSQQPQIFPVISVPADKTADIGVVRRTTNINADVADPHQTTEEFTNFSPAVHFRSAVEVAAQAQAHEDDAHQHQMDRYRDEIRDCRRTLDELPIARRALRSLFDEGDIERPAFDRMVQELDRQELRLLMSKAERANSDQLADIREEVIRFAEQHGDSQQMALACAQVLRTVAMRYLHGSDVNEQSFTDASETLDEASSLSALDDANKGRIDGYKRDLSIAQTAFSCRSGDQFECAPAYSSMMQNLYEQAWNACSGWNVDVQGCNSAATSLRSAPQQIQQVVLQRQQMMQSLYSGAGVGGGSFGSPYAGNGLALGGGLQMGGMPQTNPFLGGSVGGAMNPMGMSTYTGAGGMIPTDPLAMMTAQARGLPVMPSAPPMAHL
ncbi:MAG TPA: hypothetical protein VL588_04255 [Bdellovibrionota bacterium]|jgi:hypothetical protein|nr:hypothetical protein [Bdellovibrionota bacterium]